MRYLSRRKFHFSGLSLLERHPGSVLLLETVFDAYDPRFRWKPCLRSLYVWDTLGMCMRAQGSLIVEMKPGSMI